jgi:site-specific recombinase XerD
MAISIIAQLKKKKNTDTATIYIRGFYNRKPVATISTGHKIKVQQWDAVNRCLLPSAPNATLVNAVIESKLQQMQSSLLKKEIMGTAINRSHVVKAVRNIDDSKDFYQFCRDRIKEYNNKESRRTYKSEVTKMEQFRAVASFADIDYSYLTKYKMYMQQQLSNTHNTVWKSFKFMHTMLRKAIKMGGIIQTNPFTEFNRDKYVQTKRTFLELSHLQAIEKYVTNENEMIRRVSIYFLLMAYSGMRFADAMRFTPGKHIADGRIIMRYQKFDTAVNNKMHSKLQMIVELVKQNPLKISNQKFNQWLKVIAADAGIKVNLTAHVARHTMGGLLAEMDIPEEQAMLILGQKDIRSTRVYYHVKNKSIDAAMLSMDNLHTN